MKENLRGGRLKNSNVLPTDILMVGYDLTHGEDNKISIVGRKADGEYIDIVNAFAGDDAQFIYDLLTDIPERKNDDN